MVINDTRGIWSSAFSLSKSVARATSSKNSVKEPVASANSCWPSVKSLIPFKSSSIFSILLIPSGVPSFFKSNTMRVRLVTSSAVSKALAFSLKTCRLLMSVTKSVSFCAVPAFTPIWSSCARSATSKIEHPCCLAPTTSLSTVVCPIPLAG